MLCEKGRIGGEQSSRNWGWCRTMGRDAREIPLAMESLRLWRGMNAAHQPRNRISPGRHRLSVRDRKGARGTGSLACRGPAISGGCAAAARRRHRRRWCPAPPSRFIAALHTPTDGRAEPSQAAPAIAEAARDDGATILTDCAVRGIDTPGRPRRRRGHRKGPHRLRQPWCWPAAPGRACSAATPASICRN